MKVVAMSCGWLTMIARSGRVGSMSANREMLDSGRPIVHSIRSMIAAAVAFGLAATAPLRATPLGTAFTFQGQLKSAGSPLNDTADIQFSLWNADVSGSQVGSTIQVENVDVVDGLFTATIDFGAVALNGEARWLEVAVRTPAGIGGFTTLSPRQPVTASPYALALPGLVSVPASPATQTPSLIGGHVANNVTTGLIGGNIGGGGSLVSPNRVTDNYGTVAGGQGNRAGNDAGTLSDALEAFVGGGLNNAASGPRSSVVGGQSNTSSGSTATVGGGNGNQATGVSATVPGGNQNTAAGNYSFAAGRRAKADHQGAFVWADSLFADFASTASDQFLIRAAGGVGIGNTNPQAMLHVGGDYTPTVGGSIARFDGTVAVDGTLLSDEGSLLSRAKGGGPASASVGLDASAATGGNSWQLLSHADTNPYLAPGGSLTVYQAQAGQHRVVIDENGQVGIGTTDPAERLHVEYTGNAIYGNSTLTVGGSAGVNGVSAGNEGFGVYGLATDATGPNFGGYFNSASVLGTGAHGEGGLYGVRGVASGTGLSWGGYFEAGGIGAVGVSGAQTAATGSGAGVSGYSVSQSGTGTFGINVATSGTTYGVRGESRSPDGYGVFGINTDTNAFGVGVYGESVASGYGVYGKGVNGGVRGETTGPGVGVTGSSQGIGVYGFAVESFGVIGTTQATDPAYAGVQGGGPIIGVSGIASETTGVNFGVKGSSFSAVGYGGYFEGRGYFSNHVGIGVEPSVFRLDVRETATSATVVNLQREADAVAQSDLLQMIIGTASSNDAQFIECERGADIKFRVWGDGDVTADGTLTGGGADYAEMVKVTTGVESVEPGDVMVIDPDAARGFVKSAKARSTLVAGIYSTRPGVLGSEHDWDDVARELGLDPQSDAEPQSLKPIDLGRRIDEVPVAMLGIVPCKASAENGPIRPGDLLVTSNTVGHTMRDDNPRPGTIVGKSLGSLDSGTGVIRVLVTLQ